MWISLWMDHQHSTRYLTRLPRNLCIDDMSLRSNDCLRMRSDPLALFFEQGGEGFEDTLGAKNQTPKLGDAVGTIGCWGLGYQCSR